MEWTKITSMLSCLLRDHNKTQEGPILRNEEWRHGHGDQSPTRPNHTGLGTFLWSRTVPRVHRSAVGQVTSQISARCNRHQKCVRHGTARTQTVVCACVEDVLVHCTYVYTLYFIHERAHIHSHVRTCALYTCLQHREPHRF